LPRVLDGDGQDTRTTARPATPTVGDGARRRYARVGPRRVGRNGSDDNGHSPLRRRRCDWRGVPEWQSVREGLSKEPPYGSGKALSLRRCLKANRYFPALAGRRRQREQPPNSTDFLS
jgi:hypothetical protein